MGFLATSFAVEKGEKMKRRGAYVFQAALFFCCLAVSLHGASGKLALHADWASFRFDDKQSAWELYYAFPQNQVEYSLQDDGKYMFIANMKLKIFRDDSLLTIRGWRRQNTLDDTLSLSERTFFVDQIRLLLEPGDYRMVLIAEDHFHPGVSDSVELQTKIPAFPAGQLAVSDIELASKIRNNYPDSKDPFFKNTLYVMPSPERIFVKESPFLYFYLENYNLVQGIPEAEFDLEYRILDGDQKTVDEVKPVRRRRTNNTESRVEWGAVKVGELATGSYTLHVALSGAKGEWISKEVKFFVYNQERIQTQAPATAMDSEHLFLASSFSSMEEYALDDVFAKAIYITTGEERKQYKKIKDLDAKRRWLYRFWDTKNPVEGASPEVFYREYMRRVEYANTEFPAFNIAGWKTDRGRVYIMYGEPTFRYPFPNEPNLRPYEEWQYDNLQGGVMFIFADLNATREYRLIHSDMRGEISNDDWMAVLRSGQYR